MARTLSLPRAEGGQEAVVTMTAGGVERKSGYHHSRAGIGAAVDGVADGDVRPLGAAADVAYGSKSSHQVRLGVSDSTESIGSGQTGVPNVVPQLVEASVDRNMGVAVKQARHNETVAQVYDLVIFPAAARLARWKYPAIRLSSRRMAISSNTASVSAVNNLHTR